MRRVPEGVMGFGNASCSLATGSRRNRTLEFLRVQCPPEDGTKALNQHAWVA